MRNTNTPQIVDITHSVQGGVASDCIRKLSRKKKDLYGRKNLPIPASHRIQECDSNKPKSIDQVKAARSQSVRAVCDRFGDAAQLAPTSYTKIFKLVGTRKPEKGISISN